MAGRPILALASLIFLAGAIVLEIFVILSGAVNGSPENKVFFLQASSQGISGQGFSNIPRVAWTYFSLCPITNDLTHNCRGAHPAFPFDPQSNFGLDSKGMSQIPKAFIGSNYYYYMSRFSWAFYLIALVFSALALFTGLVALCSRIGGFLSGAMTGLAVFFQAIAAALMTAWTVKGRNAFNSSPTYTGAPAELGKYAYGFSWGAFAALFISMVLFCISGAAGGKKDTTATTTYSDGDDTTKKRGFFSRKYGPTRGEGVKSEYS